MSTTIKPETAKTAVPAASATAAAGPETNDALVTVIDNIFLNRWVTLPDGTIVKFVKSRARVPASQLAHFQNNKEFTIMK